MEGGESDKLFSVEEVYGQLNAGYLAPGVCFVYRIVASRKPAG